MPTTPYDQIQVNSQLVDIRMDVAQLSTKTERAISDLRDLGSEMKADHKDIAAKFTTVATDMATLTERVNHLPSKGFIVVALLTSLAVVGALVIFQGNLARLVGAVPAAVPATTVPSLTGSP